MERIFWNPRRNIPEAASRDSDSVTCAITSILVAANDGVAELPPADGLMPSRPFLSRKYAGSRPHSAADINVTRAPNTSTRLSVAIRKRLCPCKRKRMTPPRVVAEMMPATAPAEASSTLSIRDCLRIAAALAPRESRIAISFRRAAERAKSKHATFRQPIKSINPTRAPRRSNDVWRSSCRASYPALPSMTLMRAWSGSGRIGAGRLANTPDSTNSLHSRSISR